MKQQNVKIMKRLVVLLMLSCLLIGLGLAAAFFGYQYYTDMFGDPSDSAFGLSMVLGLGYVFLVVDAIVYFAMLCAGILLVFHMVITGILEVISIRQIRQDAPDKQRKGKRFALAALILNLIAAGVLLMLDLLFILLERTTLYPWGLLSVSLCLTGGALQIFGICTYRKLQIPPKENVDVK